MTSLRLRGGRGQGDARRSPRREGGADQGDRGGLEAGHDDQRIAAQAERVIYLRDGKVAQEAHARPAPPDLAALLDTSVPASP